MSKAADICTDSGRFVTAAKHHRNMAEIYEKDVGDIDLAMKHYEQAADYFKVQLACCAGRHYVMFTCVFRAKRANPRRTSAC